MGLVCDRESRLLASSDNANCANVAPADAGCGIVNPGPGLTTAPWPFTDKTGFHNFLNGEFYEGGINLSLFNLSHECFASVLSETRSSTSTDATLKDFVLSNFGECPSALVTTPKTGAGDDIPQAGLSIGSGSVSVKDSAALSVTGTNNFTGTLSFHICGPTLGTCDTGGVAAGSSTVTANGTYSSDTVTVTSAGRYCWRGDFVSGTQGVPNSSDSSEGECFLVTPVTPTLTTSATGPVVLGNPISDTATLGGTANQPGTPIINPTTPGAPAGGTITFQVFGPNDATCANAVFTSAPVTVSGNGTYGPVSFMPTAAGTYRWIASYTGNLPNTLAKAGACNDANETSVVNPAPSSTVTELHNNASEAVIPLGSSVALGTNVHDKATVSDTVAGVNPTGT